MSNVDEIVRQIFEEERKPFTYDPPKDSWLEKLSLDKTTYPKLHIERVKKEVKTDGKGKENR